MGHTTLATPHFPRPLPAGSSEAPRRPKALTSALSTHPHSRVPGHTPWGFLCGPIGHNAVSSGSGPHFLAEPHKGTGFRSAKGVDTG